MSRIRVRLVAAIAVAALAGVAGTTPASADPRSTLFSVTPSAYTFESGDPLSLQASLPRYRAGQVATAELQTGFDTWRAVARATVAKNGSVNIPVDSLLGDATYRVRLSSRWNRAASLPVSVNGRLKLQYSHGADLAVVSGQVITPAVRPIKLESYNGGAAGSTFQRGETDQDGRFDFTEPIDHDLELMTVSLPAVSEGDQNLIGLSFGTRVDAQPTVVGGLPSGTVGRPYSASLLTYPDDEPRPELSLDPGTLPPGLQFDAGTAIVSGTPTAAGEFYFAVNGDRAYPYRVYLTVNEPDDSLPGTISSEPPPYRFSAGLRSSDGRYVLQSGPTSFAGTAPDGWQVYLWDRRTNTRNPLIRPTAGGPPRVDAVGGELDLSPSGRFAVFFSLDPLVDGEEKTIGVYEFDSLTRSLTRIYSAPQADEVHASVSADGRVVVISHSSYLQDHSGSVRKILVWNQGEGLRQLNRNFSSSQYGGRPGAAQLSDDGRYVTYDVWSEPPAPLKVTVEQSDLHSGSTTRLPDLADPVNVFLQGTSADGGRVVVSYSDERLAVWSQSTGTYQLIPAIPASVPGHYLARRLSAVSASGRYLVIATQGYPRTAIWRYDLQTATMRRLEGLVGDPYAPRASNFVSDDGATVVLGRVPATTWRLRR